jgi:hypothetical protein
VLALTPDFSISSLKSSKHNHRIFLWGGEIDCLQLREKAIGKKINIPKHTNFGFDYFFKFQKFIAARVIWPYSFEKDSFYRERAFILSSILIAGLLFGFFALISGFVKI